MSTERDILTAAEDLARIAAAVEQRDTSGRTLLQRIRFGFSARPHPEERRPSTGPQRCDDWPEGLMPGPLRSDPTGEAAIRFDQAAHDEKAMRQHAAQLRTTVTAMLTISRRYTPRPPNAADLLALERDNTPDPLGCEICVESKDSRGKPIWGPADRKVRIKPDDPDLLVCNDHARFVLSIGRVPTEEEDAVYHKTGKLPTIHAPKKK